MAFDIVNDENSNLKTKIDIVFKPEFEKVVNKYFDIDYIKNIVKIKILEDVKRLAEARTTE